MNEEKIKLLQELLDNAAKCLRAIDILKEQKSKLALVDTYWADKWRVISFLQEEIRFVEEQLKRLGVEL